MATKVNLTPLINYFKDRDPKVANRLQGLVTKHADIHNSNFVNKIAQTLIEIADSLEATSPELAEEADDILASIVTAQMHNMHSATDASPMMESPENLHAEPLEELSLEDEIEPAQEFDEVSVDDFRNMAEGLPLRLTDRSRKERWSTAHKDAEQGMKHLQKGKELMERAHKRLDEAGDKIRLQTGFKW